MNQTGIEFRYEITVEDLNKIKTILCSSNLFNKDELEVALSIAEETLEKGKESGYNYVFLERNAEIIGFSCYGKIPCTQYSYDIYWIALENNLRRKGYGKKLLNQTEKNIKCENGLKVYIETSSKDDYLPTRKFYVKNDYVKVALLEDFYNINDHKLIYQKNL